MEVYLHTQESYLYLYRELTLSCGEVTLTFNRKVTVTCTGSLSFLLQGDTSCNERKPLFVQWGDRYLYRDLTHSFHLQENNSCTKKYFLLVQGGNA